MAKRRVKDQYISKGERQSSISTKGVGVSVAEKYLNKHKALANGHNVVWTIENPDKAQTNKRFIRVTQSAR